jgi:hypothetical protein
MRKSILIVFSILNLFIFLINLLPALLIVAGPHSDSSWTEHIGAVGIELVELLLLATFVLYLIYIVQKVAISGMQLTLALLLNAVATIACFMGMQTNYSAGFLPMFFSDKMIDNSTPIVIYYVMPLTLSFLILLFNYFRKNKN